MRVEKHVFEFTIGCELGMNIKCRTYVQIHALPFTTKTLNKVIIYTPPHPKQKTKEQIKTAS